MSHKWLVLGGTKEARDFISHWQNDRQIQIVLSLAGVTTNAPDFHVQTRVGGFSSIQDDGTEIDGATGMETYLLDNGITAVIDITHPFAAQISANARQAANKADVTYLQYLRAPWQPLKGDYWHYHESWDALFDAVKTKHLFLAGGHEALSHLPATYSQKITARMIEPPKMALQDLPEKLDIMLAKPLAKAAEEEALFRKLRVTAIAAKLSGGKASAGKLAAARALGLDVHLVKRPDYPDGWFDNLQKLHRHLRVMITKYKA